MPEIAYLTGFGDPLYSRIELARAVRRLATTQTRIEGASDHGVPEAIYLRDPDENGIELYADRPRDKWPAPTQPGERAGMYTIGLGLKELLATIDGEDPRPQAGPGLRTGHLHLHVGDVDEGLAFYRDMIGFDVMGNLGSAAFVSAGGYHHHLGFNVWMGRDVKPPPPGTAGLRHWTVVPDSPQSDRLARRDLTHTSGFHRSLIRRSYKCLSAPAQPGPKGPRGDST